MKMNRKARVTAGLAPTMGWCGYSVTLSMRFTPG